MLSIGSTSEQNLAQCVCQNKFENTEKNRTIIVGFPGFGLVGTIAAKYIIKSLNLDVIGFVRSPLIPPLAVFLDGELAYPYRIYGNLSGEKDDIIVLIGESPAPPAAYYYLANSVLDWGTNYANAKEVICLDGFMDNSDDQRVFLVAEPDIKDKMEKFGLPRPQTGYIGGLSGAILNESIIREIDGYALLVSTISHYPDPTGAANLLNTLNTIKALNIDTKPLFSDGEKIKKTMQEFANRTRQLADQEQSKSDYRSSLYI